MFLKLFSQGIQLTGLLFVSLSLVFASNAYATGGTCNDDGCERAVYAGNCAAAPQGACFATGTAKCSCTEQSEIGSDDCYCKKTGQ